MPQPPVLPSRWLFRVLLIAAITVFALSPPAGAQPAAFLQAFSELTTALEGASGDGGLRINAALDKMAAAVVAWDRAIAAAELELRDTRSDAPPAIVVERHLSLGRMYADRGRHADALMEFGAASRLAPARADLHVLRGLVLKEQGASDQALEAFRSARALDPGDAPTAYYLFTEAMLSGNARGEMEASDALAAAYAKLLQAAAPSSVALRATGDRQQTATPFTRLVPLPALAGGAPVLPYAGYSEAFRALTRGEYEHAIAEFRRASAGDPLLADPAAGSGLMARAFDALSQGRVADAQSLLEQSGPPRDSSEAYRALGLVYWAKSEYDRSIAALSIAVGLAPRNERARLTLARVLNAAGRNADAERALADTAGALPDSTLAHWWLALAHEQADRPDAARKELEQVAAAAIGVGQLHAAIGRFAIRAADDAGAIDALRRAIRAHPNDPATHRQLANALMHQDRADEALAEFVAVLLIDPADAAAHAGIGQIHLQSGRDAAAVDALRRATDLAPASSEARYTLAATLERLGRTEEAAQQFARVEEAQRQTLADRRRELAAAALKQEATARAAEGRFDVAIALYEKALAIEPDTVTYNRLADLYAKVGRPQDAARARALSGKVAR